MVGKVAAGISSATPRCGLRLVGECRRFRQRLLVAVVRTLVEGTDLRSHGRVGDHHVLLRLHVAAARPLLCRLQAGLDVGVGDRLVAEAPHGAGGHDGFDRDVVVHGSHLPS